MIDSRDAQKPLKLGRTRQLKDCGTRFLGPSGGDAKPVK